MQAILILNSGSSSIKFAVFALQQETMQKEYIGIVTNIIHKPHLKIKAFSGEVIINQNLAKTTPIIDPYTHATEEITHWLEQKQINIIAAGHRVAHGGVHYKRATVINDEVISYLEELKPLAPLHQPYNLNGIKILQKKFPEIFQVACFDTAFHTTCNPLSQLFAIPKWLTEKGVRRYGFHGLSYDYVVSQFDKYLPKDKVNGKFIIAHLGQGATMCAIHNRKSVATSIGFSALDGLPMGTRCGSLDAGVVLYLLDQEKMTYPEIEKTLYKESGLFGVSGGISSDMKELLESSNKDAKTAVDLFVYRICCWIGSLTAELQGLDGLIFTAGIGENAPYIREKVCEQIAWLGAKIDKEANNSGKHKIHDPDSKLLLYTIPTDEEETIAKETFALMSSC